MGEKKNSVGQKTMLSHKLKHAKHSEHMFP